jgi:hypothetical protein
MTAFANNFDDLIDSLFVNTTLENREKYQNERIDLEKKRLDDLKIGRGRLLEPYVTGTLAGNNPDETQIPNSVRGAVNQQDRLIQTQIDRINQLQQGLINIQELKAKEAAEKKKKEEEAKIEAEKNQRYINEGPTAPATPVSLTGNDSSQFATLIERQNEAMNNLALALNNQGEEIKRVVDRIPT